MRITTDSLLLSEVNEYLKKNYAYQSKKGENPADRGRCDKLLFVSKIYNKVH